MQKIVIKNFGPVKDAEIELKKVLVLIGEQASGKSTIAKLIYFFRSLKDELYAPILAKQRGEHLKAGFKDLARQKFITWFGKDILNSEFQIQFSYSFDKVIKLSSKTSSLNIQLSPNLLDFIFIERVAKIVEDLQSIANGTILPNYPLATLLKSGINEEIVDVLQQAFQIFQNDELFVVAGRSATVTYSELFEKFFFSNVEKNVENKKLRGIANVDDVLMHEFILNLNALRLPTIKASKALAKSNSILKGRYFYDSSDQKEYINIPDQVHNLPISQASSGQQEVLRILQDLLLLIDDENYAASKVFRIIEEPEAHLFPIAQKHLVDLFAQMVNLNEYNQLIITTHSPYILSAFNNLLFAQRVIDKNPDMESEVSEVVDKTYRLKGDDFAAYSLGNTSFAKGKYAYCESIVNPKTQLIAQNYLDEVSEMLGIEFNTLYELHAKKFARA